MAGRNTWDITPGAAKISVSVEEWVEQMEKPGDEGGCSGKKVDYEEEKKNIIDEVSRGEYKPVELGARKRARYLI